MMVRAGDREIYIPDEAAPRGCRFERMIEIIRRGLDLEEARKLVPELEDYTHKVLMAIRNGQISSGIHEIKEYVRGGEADKLCSQCKKLRDNGLTYAEIARELNISKHMATYYVRERGKAGERMQGRERAANELCGRCKEMYLGGMTVPQIASELGITERRANYYIYERDERLKPRSV